MKKLRIGILFGITLLIINSCANTQKEDIRNKESKPSDDININSIWKLDYYPDSIFINKSINDNSIWNSSYAYNIVFSKDSCQFIGWHESWWNKLIRIDNNHYRTNGEDKSQYWEINFITDNKLLMREVIIKKNDTIKNKFYPYHIANKVLKQTELLKMINQKIFKGEYKVIFNDTIKSDTIIKIKDDFKLDGFEGYSSYSIDTEMDDYSITNSFGFRTGENKIKVELSFSFNRDTLCLNNYKWIYDEYGDIIDIKATEPRIKLLKIK